MARWHRQILLNPGPVTLTDRVRAALTARRLVSSRSRIRGAAAGHQPAPRPRPPGAGRRSTVPSRWPAPAPRAVEAHAGQLRAGRDATTLVVANGVYGERMARMLGAHGKPHRVRTAGWHRCRRSAACDPALDARSGHHATSPSSTTRPPPGGSMTSTPSVRSARHGGVTLLLDAVSSFGAERIDRTRWNLGALAAPPTSACTVSPGLSFVLARASSGPQPPERTGSVYLDLRAYHAGQHGDGFSPFTLPVQVAFALREALAEHAEQGGWQARVASCTGRARSAFAATLAPARRRRRCLPPTEYSSVLWSWRLPAGRTYARPARGTEGRGLRDLRGAGRPRRRSLPDRAHGRHRRRRHRPAVLRRCAAILGGPATVSEPVTTAVILAAGRGTRLRAESTTVRRDSCSSASARSSRSRSAGCVAAGIQRCGDRHRPLRRALRGAARGQRRTSCARCTTPEFADSGSMYSLYCARERWLHGPFLLLESDLVYEPRALRVLLERPAADAILLSGPTGAGDEVYRGGARRTPARACPSDRARLGAGRGGRTGRYLARSPRRSSRLMCASPRRRSPLAEVRLRNRLPRGRGPRAGHRLPAWWPTWSGARSTTPRTWPACASASIRRVARLDAELARAVAPRPQ